VGGGGEERCWGRGGEGRGVWRVRGGGWDRGGGVIILHSVALQSL
jgi:hypothetical protein